MLLMSQFEQPALVSLTSDFNMEELCLIKGWLFLVEFGFLVLF